MFKFKDLLFKFAIEKIIIKEVKKLLKCVNLWLIQVDKNVEILSLLTLN